MIGPTATTASPSTVATRRRERQPLAPDREARVEQPQACAGGKVEEAGGRRADRPLDPQDAERGALQGRKGGPLVGVGRPVLAGEPVDGRRARWPRG